MKIELHEMLTILIFADNMPVATIVNEGLKWAVMLTSEMPLHMTPFDSREKALDYVYERINKATPSKMIDQMAQAR